MHSVSGPAPMMTDRWTFTGSPALVAHRGYARRFPENTLVSIAAAVDAGAGFVEFDVQLSKDQKPFLMHDDNFRRTAGIDHNVFDLTMAEIKTLCVGEPERLGGRFHNVRPITLRQLCNHLNGWPSIHAFVEIKRQSVEHFGLDLTMARVSEALQELRTPYTIISFRTDVIEFARQAGTASTGWVIRDWNAESIDTLHRLAPQFVFCNYRKIPDTDILPKGSWAWVLYEITDADVADHWRNRGADMIESMAVSAMLKMPPFALATEALS